MFSPTPWKFVYVANCGATKQAFGDIIGADGVSVAEGVYEKDAEAIIKAVNASEHTAALGDEGSKK